MTITARHRGAQSGLKGQVVLVPTDLKRIQQALPRSTYEGHLVTVSIKRILTDLSAYIKQNIRPEKINAAFKWLKENNPLYQNVNYDENWEKSLRAEDQDLWDMLTTDTPNNFKNEDEVIDSESDGEELEGSKEKIHPKGIPKPSVLYNVHGPDVDVDKIIEVAPAEGQVI